MRRIHASSGTTGRRMDALQVRVEARHDTGPDRRAAAAALVRAVKESVGISVTCSVIEPDTLERSLGKLHRLVDHRPR
ncbi:MAG TPA: hypothetical protein VGP05_09870 [Pseudonocardia sp.]|nr:hypothetical protein [Pseudonocardia sp.]